MDPGFRLETTPRRRRSVRRECDAEDPLSRFRERFDVPGELYLDGNSLGPISDAAERSLERAVRECRELGIEAWIEAARPWFRYGESLGADLAGLVGADDEEVVVANSTTVNVHTLVGTFLDTRGDRPPGILVNELDFPTDHYAIRAQLCQRGYEPDEHLHLIESRDGRTIAEADIVAALDDYEIGIVFMPSVLYRCGQLLDVERLTTAAHGHGAFAGFDFAHSVGVVPHDLAEHGVDFAVWCSYKYLNAGPGAIAGLYVNERYLEHPEAARLSAALCERGVVVDFRPRTSPGSARRRYTPVSPTSGRSSPSSRTSSRPAHTRTSISTPA
jgi:kynureninase